MVSLETSKIFAHLPASEAKKLAKVARTLRFGPGEVIFREGDPGDGLYVVESGEVQISTVVGAGERHVFSTVPAGEVFGEMAVLDNLPRSAHASVEKETSVIFVPREPFVELLKGSPALCVTLVQEISRRLRVFNQQYIRKVLQVERMALVGRFASSIVHDLKNPLSIIRVGGAQAAEPKATAEERKTAQKRIEAQVERITSMVNDILEFTRGTPQEVPFAKMEFNYFVDRIINEFRQELETRGVTIDYENPPPTSRLRMNPQRLSRVFYNLIFNAVDAMRDGGRIRLRFAETENELTIEVEDSGPGIASEMVDRLFEPFATFGKAHGTGLGLSISQRIVAEHGGKIWGRNRAGGGAVFTITLPRER